MASQLALLLISAAALTLLWWRLSLGTRARVAALDTQTAAVSEEIAVFEARALKLRRALDTAKIVVWEVDPATQAVRRNPLSCAVERGGCPIAFADPNADLASVHPADHEPLLGLQRALRSGESPTRAEFRTLAASGAVSHFLGVATQPPSAMTPAINVVGVSMDITTLRTAELARATHRERIQRAADATPDYFYEIDMKSGQMWFARPFREWLGYPGGTEPATLAETRGLHHPGDLELANQDMWRHLEGKAPLFESEYRVRRADGEWIWLSAKGSVERNEAGVALRLSGVTREITEKKAFQRTLIEAREAAAAANRAKGEFLANMSHEIRTPMNGVIGMADLLLDTELDATQRDYAATIRDCSSALLTVINDVLDFSKLEAKKLELEIIDIDLHSTVAAVERQLAAQARAQGLEFTLQVDPALPAQVRGDPGRIQQILLNLGGNGIKFTQHGAVSITLQRLEHPAEGVWLRCEVRDTGVGIPSERLGSLFEPFSQIDASRTRKHGGAGLGLCIVSRLVALMGGETGVESTMGQGSCFWFTACFAEVAAGAGQPLIAPPRATMSHGHERRILVVDDNPVNRKVTQRLLTKLGCRADCVASGKEAIAAWESGRYHLILMDCQMPDMDGFEATRQIRRLEAGARHIPIVALTADVDRAIDAECAAAGMDDTLAKPIERTLLEDTLARYLAEQQTPPGEAQ